MARVPTGLWVSDLRISPRTAQKIQARHGLHPPDLKAAVVGQYGLHYSWDYDSERGLRAMVKVRVGGQLVLMVLYPRTGSDPHAFNLGSAYRI